MSIMRVHACVRGLCCGMMGYIDDLAYVSNSLHCCSCSTSDIFLDSRYVAVQGLSTLCALTQGVF